MSNIDAPGFCNFTNLFNSNFGAKPTRFDCERYPFPVVNDDEHKTENLFSYGTLRQEDVQLATFGRRLAGRPDAVVGYALKIIQIQDQSFAAQNGPHQRTLQFTGSASDVVAGVALALTREELEQADEYEPDDYERVRVQLRSGLDAWVYLQNGQ